MPVCLLLVALLFCSAGEALKDSGSVKIQTLAGETVILPCHVNVTEDIPSVEWSKEGLDPNIILAYRDGFETFEEKNPIFRYRTHLFFKELKHGNISLRLSNVQLSDEGKYKCRTTQGGPREVVTIELSVGAVSEPKLSIVSAQDGGVTLQCEADCWFPQPKITFVDAQGNISAENTKTPFDSRRGCFNVTGRVTVKTADRVSCRVHQHEIIQTRVTEISIPDKCMRSCTLNITIAAVAPILVCALIALLYKTCGNSVGVHKLLSTQSSHRSSTYSIAEGPNPGNQTDATTEHQRKIHELESKLQHKEEIIHKQTEELKDLQSKQSPVVCHFPPIVGSSSSQSSPDVSKPLNLPPGQFPHSNNPKPAASTNCKHSRSVSLPQNNDPTQIPAPPQIQRSRNNHSSPALLTSRNAVSLSSSSIFPLRSMSMSESRPRPNGAKPQRRNTTSHLSANRFTALANLPEDDSVLLL